MKYCWLFLILPIFSKAQDFDTVIKLIKQPALLDIKPGFEYQVVSGDNNMYLEKYHNDGAKHYIGQKAIFIKATKDKSGYIFQLPDKNTLTIFPRFNILPGITYTNNLNLLKSYLNGKELYIMTDFWFLKEGEKNIVKFFKIKIIDVQISKSAYGGTYDVWFVGPEGVGYTWINEDGDLFSPSKSFSHNDPKLKYPDISDSNWDIIRKGKVSIGMSKKECELSWGKPDKINKTTTISGTDEQWIYNNGNYLYITNNILTSIQN